MKVGIYLFLAILLLLFAYIVFRRIVRRDYFARGHLSTLASVLQLLVFIGFFALPYLFNPPEWPWFWTRGDSDSRVWQLIGFVFICIGSIFAFGTMAWFGIGKAFGLHVGGLTYRGPYKISRNPQVLGGYLLVIGAALQRPSIFSLGWMMMYAIIAHWMVITEEEHLSRVFGEEYKTYCTEVPRYFLNPRNRNKTST